MSERTAESYLFEAAAHAEEINSIRVEHIEDRVLTQASFQFLCVCMCVCVCARIRAIMCVFYTHVCINKHISMNKAGLMLMLLAR